MKHNEFRIDEAFWCGGHQWRCTDIGTHTVVAICLDRVDVGGPSPHLLRTLNRAEAEAEGWFNGPPYAVAQRVFDEYGIVGCSITPDEETQSERGVSEAVRGRLAPLNVTEGSKPTDAAGGSSEGLTPARAYAATLREQARLGGLRFESYLPGELAEWLLAKIESGAFTDPGEGVCHAWRTARL